AREFAARVHAAAPALGPALSRVTEAYERVRFGGAGLGADEAGALERCIAHLRSPRVPPARPA
ncbi:MAG TPA: DUF4129 domain-containing protein, partial [Candidatus Tectomicrobia bacterium]|nr:DUF4129 domain-containing protein [Candidatus Tectomicrobia bacterium]